MISSKMETPLLSMQVIVERARQLRHLWVVQRLQTGSAGVTKGLVNYIPQTKLKLWLVTTVPTSHSHANAILLIAPVLAM
jgi:hypothetical protein